MRYSTLTRLVHVTAVVATAAVIAGWVLTLDAVRAGLPDGAVRLLATVLLAIPLGIHLGFTLLQGVPGGRRIVPLRPTRSPDAWLLIFVVTMFGPKAQLAAWAHPMLAAGERGVSLSLITATLVIAARVFQLNRGAALGVTAETESTGR